MNDEGDLELPNESLEPVRQRIDVQVGNYLRQGGSIYRITEVLDFDTAIGIDVDDGRSRPLRIKELRPVAAIDPDYAHAHDDLEEIADEDWRVAEERYAAIKPLAMAVTPGRSAVDERAKEVGVSPSTIYRWLERYKSLGVVSALIPRQRGWKVGNSRISGMAEAVIREVIDDVYLTPQRPTDQTVVMEVKRRCHEQGINPPSPSAVRSRIAKVPERTRMRRRGFREKARNQFQPTPGRFPNADYPLAYVQIDHTPVDVVLVDDEHRLPIGRPWISVAIDVYSRTVTGYYLSFDAPSATSVAMCIAHSILPKDDWLTLHGVEADWPVWGFPVTVHVDNGPDFRSDTFRRACEMYGINLEFRPVKAPRYGGHIERLLGSFMNKVHSVPGTTFSSVPEREGCDSEKHASMTKTEFERWLVTLITRHYHNNRHNGLGVPPIKQWETGIFGDANNPGTGIPPRPRDSTRLLLDFLPSFRRTVQTFGVTIEGMHYYDEALRPWINAKNPDDSKRKRQLVFRRDPRDISHVWFFDPDLKQYFKIPFADLSLPSMSIWELNQAKEKLKREGKQAFNEHLVLEALTELRDQVEKSKAKTKKARRQAQRRKEHERRVTPVNPVKPSEDASQDLSERLDDGLLDDTEIGGLGDIS